MQDMQVDDGYAGKNVKIRAVVLLQGAHALAICCNPQLATCPDQCHEDTVSGEHFGAEMLETEDG